MKVFAIIFLFVTISDARRDRLDQYRNKLEFTVFSYNHPHGVLTQFDNNMMAYDCDPNLNLTLVVHGWLESIDRPWVRPMINEFLKLRGNCVYFMDYSVYGLGAYGALTPHFYNIADVLVEKIGRSWIRPENLYMFGFSFGARLVTKVGAIIGENKVDRIYACDPAGPGFDPYYSLDPKTSATFIACIHTSNNYGTQVYNCHQDWRMGMCGHTQVGAKPFPCGSHGLCPYFFLASFNENFYANNVHNCGSNRLASDLPSDLIMGPRESRTYYSGDIFTPTAPSAPWSGTGAKWTFPDFDEETEIAGLDYYNELSQNPNNLRYTRYKRPLKKNVHCSA